jgi:N-acetylglucosaminyl-diphospho-decaprenol L-rhamnosyltransferase
MSAQSPTRPLVSLIVVTYNAELLLPTFFSHLDRTRYSPYEVIVVDNASTDGTRAFLESEQPAVKLLANEVGYGYGRGCNQGADIARGELLVFMNPDVYVTPEWLDVLVQHLSENPDIGIISPQAHPPGKTFSNSAVPFEELAAVPGCAMMVRRSAWNDLGGFNSEFFLYWEDTDLCWRAWLLGWRVAADLQAHVVHDEGAGGGGQQWAEAQIRNGLFTYLRLLRWRAVIPFLPAHAGKTILKAARLRRPALFRAWWWNARRLPAILEDRRRVQRTATGDRAALERRIRANSRRRKREWISERYRLRGRRRHATHRTEASG